MFADYHFRIDHVDQFWRQFGADAALQKMHEEFEQADQTFKQLPQDEDLSYLRNRFDPGHFTGSALITDTSFSHVLLTHHKKLDKWLQLGGHADGDRNLAKVALREAIEESGIPKFQFVQFHGPDFRTLTFDCDCHVIPERKNEAEHLHFDVRFLLVADHSHPITVTDESNDVAWFPLEEAFNMTSERSMHRQMEKLQLIREAHSQWELSGPFTI